MKESRVHLIIVWPIATPYYKNIVSKILSYRVTILCAVKLYPTHYDLGKFISDIYSESKYDLLRLEEKKENILRDYRSEDGVIAIFFSMDHDNTEWNEERGRFVYPDVLIAKELIRSDVQKEIGTASKYETIHMTDDLYEFQNDFPALIRLLCLSKQEYYFDVYDK